MLLNIISEEKKAVYSVILKYKKTAVVHTPTNCPTKINLVSALAKHLEIHHTHKINGKLFYRSYRISIFLFSFLNPLKVIAKFGC